MRSRTSNSNPFTVSSSCSLEKICFGEDAKRVNNSNSV